MRRAATAAATPSYCSAARRGRTTSQHTLASLLAAVALLSGCAHFVAAPAAPSPAAAPRYRQLHAGIGRVEITPPMGAGLFGYGPEGKKPEGFRHRLFARALVLEDARGERIALVVADLGATSLLLHREVAQRLARAAAPVGADRLVIAATHTHSGPGNFLGMTYDEFGTASDAAGHDPVLLDFLAERIELAVRSALDAMRPARVAWGITPVWGLTRNRSLEAWQNNAPRWLSPLPPAPGLDDVHAAVDPAWTMLRVDQQEVSGSYRPAAAFSIFAIHGTAVPSANTLYDGDVHAILARRLERHIDSLNQRLPGPRPHAVHLVGNGSEGDVSPDVSPATRCPVPRLRSKLLIPPAFISNSLLYWVPPADDVVNACLEHARDEVLRLGNELAARAISLFDALRPTDDVALIARAYRMHTLHGPAADLPGICREARIGVGSPSGVADGKTRYDGIAGIREGNRDLRSTDCHSPKIPFLGEAQRVIVGAAGLPRTAQFTVFRIGPMTIGTVPSEITVTAGGRAKEALSRAARLAGLSGDSVALLALTNGYMGYTTTAEEYVVQRYEAASTLYGPGQADAFARALAALAQTLGPPAAPSPPATVPQDRVRIFGTKARTAHADDGPADITRQFGTQRCSGGELFVRWLDLAPGRMMRDTTVWFEIRRAPRGELVAWDDHQDVDVRLEQREKTGAWWSLRWVAARNGETYDVAFRPGSASTQKVTLTCGP